MFKPLGIIVLLYALYAAYTGTVYARAGIRMRVVSREDSPAYFWVVTVIYLGLGIAMIIVF